MGDTTQPTIPSRLTGGTPGTVTPSLQPSQLQLSPVPQGQASKLNSSAPPVQPSNLSKQRAWIVVPGRRLRLHGCKADDQQHPTTRGPTRQPPAATNSTMSWCRGVLNIVAFLKQHPTLQRVTLDLNERVRNSAFMFSNFYTVVTAFAGFVVQKLGSQQMQRPQKPNHQVGFPLLWMGVPCLWTSVGRLWKSRCCDCIMRQQIKSLQNGHIMPRGTLGSF